MGFRRQGLAACMNPAGLQFALGRLFLPHLNELELGFSRDDDDLSERLAWSENVRTTFGRRLEDDEVQHRPPPAQQRRHRDWHAVCRVGVETRMGLDPDGHALLDFEIEKDLIGIELLAECSEWRPFYPRIRIGPEVAIEDEAPISRRDAQLIIERIEQLNSILRAFGKRHAVPRIFVRAVLAGFRFARPSGNVHLGSPWAQPRLEQSTFDRMHGGILDLLVRHSQVSTGVSSPCTSPASEVKYLVRHRSAAKGLDDAEIRPNAPRRGARRPGGG